MGDRNPVASRGGIGSIHPYHYVFLCALQLFAQLGLRALARPQGTGSTSGHWLDLRALGSCTANSLLLMPRRSGRRGDLRPAGLRNDQLGRRELLCRSSFFGVLREPDAVRFRVCAPIIFTRRMHQRPSQAAAGTRRSGVRWSRTPSISGSNFFDALANSPKPRSPR